MKNMFIGPLKNSESYTRLVDEVSKGTSPISTYGIIEENIGHISYALNRNFKRQILIITYDDMRARRIYEGIKNFDEDMAMLFPTRELLFYKVDAISTEINNQRLRVLSRLMQGEPLIVVASIESILNKLIDPDIFRDHMINIEVGDTLELDDLSEALVSCGYERESMVEGVGQFSIRGGIMDFFAPDSDNPYRVELFDDEVDSIRPFDIGTQRSLNMLQSIYTVPVKEVFVLDDFKEHVIENMREHLRRTIDRLDRGSELRQNLEDKFGAYIEELGEGLHISNMDMIVPYMADEYLSSLLGYFESDSIVILDEPKRIEDRMQGIEKQFMLDYEHLLELGEVLPQHGKIIYGHSYIKDEVKKKITVANTALLKAGFNVKPRVTIKFLSKPMQSFHNKMEILKEELEHYRYRGYKVIIFTGTEERGKKLEKTLMDLGVESIYVEDSNRDIRSSQIFITPGSIKTGFEYTDIKFAFIGEREIYSSVKGRAKRKKRKVKEDAVSFSELNPGDYVVHENHGIGRYEGTEQLDIQGIKKDYLTISYQGNDKLYVPVDQLDLLQRYTGSESDKPKINRLSSPEWARTKQRVKKAVENMAKDLLELYAKRESLKGHSFSKDTPWQSQFEDTFPYEETESQIRSVEEIKEDMEKSRPMDRLLCGDVGYGKTEVALRAAFKAVMDGKQVAFLVPTTILAQQHYNTIIDRFANFPINVGMLSRFRTAKEQKKTVDGLRKGTIDIVVGTHRLLSKDIAFNDLGLLIVDEEQRFGVKHKETLKKLKENVDVLTLTATPIPRTLHMSLIGVRDMSTIDEPPEDRYPVQTYVVEFNEHMVREAILKEMERDGQVYFVYNRVETIDRMASQLKKIIPEAKIAVAHGQMGERELESIMMDFIDNKYDVLVCTTIIETGLDIQNVNTMIIYDADKMGLAQLYQLKGRIGRTNRVAYAYFTYEKDKVLTEVAEKRLRAIRDFTEFGSGFKIAMRDLEIRGSGNLLGVEQHGHIEAIGYDLYIKYLNQTIRKLKGEVVDEAVDTTIDLAIDGYITEEYIEDQEQKIEIYKKIAAIRSEEDYGELLDELIDRFGDVPKEVQNLMDISYIKNRASGYKINNIIQTGNTVTLEFDSMDYITPDLINYLSIEYGRKLYFDLSNAPCFKYRFRGCVVSSLKTLLDRIDLFCNKKVDV